MDNVVVRPAAWRVPWRAVALTLAWVGLVVIGWTIFAADSGGDAHAYWVASQVEPYRATVDERDAFLYSPAFLHAMWPLQHLPWEAFRLLWLIVGLGALVWMTGPAVAVIVLLPGIYSPVWTDLYFGNIYVPMTAALVLGRRHPAAWSFLALTKVTPGMVIAWYALRREWGPFAVAVGVTGALALASFLLAPHLWAEWTRMLMATDATVLPGVPPLVVRLAVAALVLALGAWKGWPAVLPLVVLLAQPVLWYSAFTLLVAWMALLRDRRPEADAERGQGVVRDNLHLEERFGSVRETGRAHGRGAD